MPRARRHRTIGAPAENVWKVVSDPDHLPRWWPGVERVEEASRDSWTQVFRSKRGKTMRADFTLVESEPLRLLRWRQEVESTPFERFLAESVTEVRLEPEGGNGATRVELASSQRMRGLARLGSPLVRGATAKRLDEALEGLDAIVGR